MVKFKRGDKVKVTLTTPLKTVEFYGTFHTYYSRKNSKGIVVTDCNGEAPYQGTVTVAPEAVSRAPIASYSDSDVYESEINYMLGEGLSDQHFIWMEESFIDHNDEVVHYMDLFTVAVDNDDFINMIKAKGGWAKLERFAENSLSNSEAYQIAWDDFLQTLKNELEIKNEVWKGNYQWRVTGTHIGWRNMSGYTEFRTADAKEFVSKIAPNSDFSIYIYDAHDHLEAQLYHHDSPTGETYEIWLMEEWLIQNLTSGQMGTAIKLIGREYDIAIDTRNYTRKKKTKAVNLAYLMMDYDLDYMTVLGYIGAKI